MLHIIRLQPGINNPHMVGPDRKQSDRHQEMQTNIDEQKKRRRQRAKQDANKHES